MFPLFASIARAIGFVLLPAAAALTFVTAANPAPPAASGGPSAADAPSGPVGVFRPAIPRRIRPVLRQYHDGTSAVSPEITPSIPRQTCCQINQLISYQSGGKARLEQRERLGLAENGQYQAGPRQYQREDFMVRIGLVLGMTYLAFVAIWIWATRLRPH